MDYCASDLSDALRINSEVPLRQLMYECQYMKKVGKRYRKAPCTPMESLSMFSNGSAPDEDPNVELTATPYKKVEVWMTRTITADEQLNIDYGRPCLRYSGHT